MPLQFVDTNVILRHLLDDDLVQSPRASSLLERVEAAELRLETSEIVIFEAVFTLERTYKQPKATVRSALRPILELAGLVVPGKERLRRAFDVYVDSNVSFADAYHAVLAADRGIEEIYSFDHDFDRIPGIRRIEP